MCTSCHQLLRGGAAVPAVAGGAAVPAVADGAQGHLLIASCTSE